jgi:glycosyltransferase involved in cell wall biosynthesis
MMQGLKDEFDFSFVASSEAAPKYVHCATPSQWQRYENHNYVWLNPRCNNWSTLRRLFEEVAPDLVLLSSLFDREFTAPLLLLRKLGFLPDTPILLSPRGECADGALSLKRRRKQAYLKLMNSLNLLEDVWLHATADHEVENIRSLKISNRGILLAPNPSTLADPPKELRNVRAVTKNKPLRLAFLGRITAVKNVLYAIDVLSQVRVPVVFDLFGPVSDRDYWSQCETKILGLPSHVFVSAKGVLPHENVPSILTQYDLFFLPTMGENFGHAIQEALGAGLPALISDQTPWVDLGKHKAGWSLALDDTQGFVKAIEHFAGLDAEQRHDYRQGARRLAEQKFAESNALEAHCEMFRKVLGLQ